MEYIIERKMLLSNIFTEEEEENVVPRSTWISSQQTAVTNSSYNMRELNILFLIFFSSSVSHPVYWNKATNKNKSIVLVIISIFKEHIG